MTPSSAVTVLIVRPSQTQIKGERKSADFGASANYSFPGPAY
jgi:hypothetical protein